mgnify:CR=1 FL=1
MILFVYIFIMLSFSGVSGGVLDDDTDFGIPGELNKNNNEENQSRFGFVNFAETWNGRMAMMGILIGLGTELITGQSILRQIGIG